MTANTPTTCVGCGVPIQESIAHIEHFHPKHYSSRFQNNNLFLWCNNCNSINNAQPPETEFVAFLTQLINNNKHYTKVMENAVLGREVRHRADIIATRINSTKTTTLLIECKSSRFASFNRIESVIDQLKKYKNLYGECQMVFAIMASLNTKEKALLKAENIELWDLDFLVQNFSAQIEQSPSSHFKSLLSSRIQRGNKRTREDELRESLKACEPGKRDWSIYQSLVGDILEHLFCPILAKPLPEHSDSTKTNRRDFILPNYAESGFWSFIRHKYIADYLVVDAKNYSRKVSKAEILQVSNYLKPHGAGCFGAIFSRKGGDSAGCAHTLREQWLINQKMILVFDDEEVYSMLTAKEDERSPEELIGKKIEQFRLSM
ncbi:MULTISPECIES: HNH endonuclease [unclassified Pseudomonas]|uniref:HNH endonuclease n=1 Tax=unclassified Pseudomonas TaxID=196821 RepID=UPI00111BE341|nr:MULTISPECIES: HNH endonuclease [unclassified Pseudomonas]